jgi:hypothetical protein
MRTRLACALLSCAALCGCRDFDLERSLPEDAVYDLKVEPLRVAPGATLTITFGLRVGAEVEVSVNGLAATRVAGGQSQRWTYRVAGDEGELLNVVAVAALGDSQKQSSAQAYLDAQPPPPPAADRLSLIQRPPGQRDEVAGLAGACRART